MIPDKLDAVIRTYCESVNTGKPAACQPVQERYKDMAIDIIHSYGILSYTEPLSDGWITIWMYRYTHILDVIKQSPQVPKSQYDHWVIGKLFGYDENSIEKFLLRHE
ncbi:hypothetical protein [Cytobacillus purgationiresistens]|uniref:Uncharacterized protein n=1 Tax=Cytobacillus purgationiresistens TaxID=863449 RepID=A0ABU0ACA9_9BACI|nr:hypothetical protein [Cytobacillus purgationiresistens]MDQ0268889.1 hypothetical protein [Cytobacillus purgationiresistens]